MQHGAEPTCERATPSLRQTCCVGRQSWAESTVARVPPPCNMPPLYIAPPPYLIRRMCSAGHQAWIENTVARAASPCAHCQRDELEKQLAILRQASVGAPISIYATALEQNAMEQRFEQPALEPEPALFPQPEPFPQPCDRGKRADGKRIYRKRARESQRLRDAISQPRKAIDCDDDDSYVDGDYDDAPPRKRAAGGHSPTSRYGAQALANRLQEMKAQARRRGGRCLTDRLRYARDKAIFVCAENHVWQAEHTHVVPRKNQRGTWCPQCAHRARKNAAHADSAYAATYFAPLFEALESHLSAADVK